MWKKGTLNLFERDYKEYTGLKRGEKGKPSRKRVNLARDLKKIRKGEGGKAHGGRGQGVRSRDLDKMAQKSELSGDIQRGKYAKSRSSKKERDEAGIHAVHDRHRKRKGGGQGTRKGDLDAAFRGQVDMETTRQTSNLAGKAERSNYRRKNSKS